jgi:cytoskeleton-associated protein 5
MPLLEDVREAQKKELEQRFSKVAAASAESSAPPAPLRARRGCQSGDGASGDAAAAASATLFAKEEVALELMKKFDVKAFVKGMGEEKWKMRKDAIDALIKMAEPATLLDPECGDYGEVVAPLKKALKSDSNAAVVAAAIKALGLLGRGLQKSFSVHTSTLLPAFLGKLGDKNRGVTAAVDGALDNMHGKCYTITEDKTLEMVAESMKKAKDPKARAKMYEWLGRASAEANTKSLSRVMGALSKLVMSGIADSTPPVRDAATIMAGVLLHALGEEQLGAILSDKRLDKFKERKLREHAASLGGGPPPSKAPPHKAPLADIRRSVNRNPPPKSKPAEARKPKPKPEALASSKRPVSGGGAGRAGGRRRAAHAPTPVTCEPSLSDESAEALLSTLSLPADLEAMLRHKSFKIRIAAIGNLERCLFGEPLIPVVLADAEVGAAPERPAPLSSSLAPAFAQVALQLTELTVTWLGKCVPKFKDSNFQVVVGIWSLLTRLVQSEAGCGRYSASLVVAPMLEKINDRKIKPAARACLSALAESCGPNFVYTLAYKTLSTAKSPPVLAETLSWVQFSIKEEFGLGTVDTQAMLDACKGCLESSNATVRAAAVQLVATMGLYVGDGVLDLMADVKPATLSTLSKALEGVAGQAPPVPTRTVRCADELPGAGGMAGELPRTDIGKHITPALLAQLKESDWKMRGKALDSVAAEIVAAGKRITPNVEDLPSSLAQRLGDSNQSLRIKAMDLCGALASAMGPAVGERLAPVVLPKIVPNICDNKSVVREATMRTLDILVAEIGIRPVVGSVAAAGLTKDQGRTDMLGWLLKHLTALEQRQDEQVRGPLRPRPSCPRLAVTGTRLCHASALVTRAFPSWNRSILTEFYLCHACSYHEIENGNARLQMPEMAALVEPVLACMLDRKPDVRTLAEQMLGLLARTEGYATLRERLSAFTRRTSVHKTAAMSLGKAVERLRPAAAADATPAAPAQASSARHAPGAAKRTGGGGGRVKARSASSKANRMPQPAVVAEEVATDTGALLRPSNKTARENKAKRGYILEDMKLKLNEHTTALMQQMEGVVAPALLKQLFNRREFKTQIAAMDELRRRLSDYPAELISSLDLVLKYVVLKIWESNAQLHSKSIELLNGVLAQLAAADYSLTAHEAGIVLPQWIEKLGSNNSSIRQGMRKTLHAFTQVYPMSKLFGFVLEGLQSKVRSRALPSWNRSILTDI